MDHRLTTARSCHGPASVRRPSRLLFRQRDGVTAVAVRGAVLRTLLAATAAPLRLRHVGPGRAAQAIDVGRTRHEDVGPTSIYALIVAPTEAAEPRAKASATIYVLVPTRPPARRTCSARDT